MSICVHRHVCATIYSYAVYFGDNTQDNTHMGPFQLGAMMAIIRSTKGHYGKGGIFPYH